jgi:DNA-binding NarL/FixJ family response regulator
MGTQAEPSMLSVVIADRRPHFRETLRRVLVQRTQATVAGEADTLHSALRVVRSTGANVVLLDIDLVMGQPAGRLRTIADSLPGLTVIVLLSEDTPGYRSAIADRWGYACVAKDRAESELLQVLPPVRARDRVSGS